jgi:hypothetical protein
MRMIADVRARGEMIAPDPVAFTHPLLAVGAGDTQQVSGTGSAGRHTS